MSKSTTFNKLILENPDLPKLVFNLWLARKSLGNPITLEQCLSLAMHALEIDSRDIEDLEEN